MTQFTNPFAGMLGGFDMRGALNGILSGDSELAQQHQREKARTLPSPGSAAYGALSPEEQAAVDAERERRQRVARQQRADYIESVGGYGNYEGGFTDADYWNAGWADMDGSYYYGGEMYDGTTDPTNGYNYNSGGMLGAGHWQGGYNGTGSASFPSGGGSSPDGNGGGGNGGGGNGGGTGSGYESTPVTSSTPFMDAYLRAKQRREEPNL